MAFFFIPPDILTPFLIGQYIRSRRKEKEMTLEALSRITGVGTTTIHALERGNPHVQLDNFLKVVSALEIPLEEAFPVRWGGGRLPEGQFEEELARRAKHDMPGLLKLILELSGQNSSASSS